VAVRGATPPVESECVFPCGCRGGRGTVVERGLFRGAAAGALAPRGGFGKRRAASQVVRACVECLVSARRVERAPLVRSALDSAVGVLIVVLQVSDSVAATAQ